ncbi:MAG: MBL fold metallo-hydrolase [Lachnospiraceae bacterium]
MQEHIKIHGVQVGPIQTNCYVITNTETKEAVLVDPGEAGEQLAHMLQQEELTLSAVLLTHGHFDHILGIPALQQTLDYEFPIYAAEAEKPTLNQPEINLSVQSAQGAYRLDADVYLEDGREITLLGEPFQCIHIPGHTLGGMCYYMPNEKILLSGDNLFEGSIGRSDLPGGNEWQLITAIKEKVMKLPDDTLVLPGHGNTTTIAREKLYNMCLK